MTLLTTSSVAAAAILLTVGCARVSPSTDLVFRGTSVLPEPLPQETTHTSFASTQHPGLAFAPQVAGAYVASPSFTIDRQERENAAFVGYDGPKFTFFTTITDDRQLSFTGWGRNGRGGSFDRLDRRAVSVTVGSRQQ